MERVLGGGMCATKQR